MPYTRLRLLLLGLGFCLIQFLCWITACSFCVKLWPACLSIYCVAERARLIPMLGKNLWFVFQIATCWSIFLAYMIRLIPWWWPCLWVWICPACRGQTKTATTNSSEIIFEVDCCASQTHEMIFDVIVLLSILHSLDSLPVPLCFIWPETCHMKPYMKSSKWKLTPIFALTTGLAVNFCFDGSYHLDLHTTGPWCSHHLVPVPSCEINIAHTHTLWILVLLCCTVRTVKRK